jgi:2-oxoglutarate dehydrogenase E1 component
MGPWPHYQLNVWPELAEKVGIRIEPVTRDASASPSVGVAKRHQEEQKDLLARAFARVDPLAEGTEQY